MDSQAYRADIDGLRAVAVLLVVLFHVGLGPFGGGFVGVDVFFVISGFLISSIIRRDLVLGTFSYRTFYRRRILRLMPALFLVTFVTAAVACIFLLPAPLMSFARSLVALDFSVSNIFFWRENGGYFEGDVQQVPLLHTWSLAVEEQYYLIWPMVLIVGYRLLRPRQLFSASVVLLVLLVFLSEWVSRRTFGAAYYLLPTRMFELMIGSLLALEWQRMPRLPGSVANLISVAGIVAIVGSSLWLNENDRFPGFNALYPTVGTAFLIFTGRTGAIVNRVLATRPFVFVGLISYSLYLWHWPIIVFCRQAGIQITRPVAVAIVAFAVVLAWLSWKFIELRFRRQAVKDFWPVARTFFITPALVALVVAGLLLATRGMPQRFDQDVLAMSAALTAEPRKLRGECHAVTRDSDRDPSASCRFGDQSAVTPRVFLIGDSFANHFTGFLDELLRGTGLGGMDYTLDACLPVFDLAWGNSTYMGERCQARNERAKSYISGHSPRYVVLAGNWPGPDEQNLVQNADGSTLTSAQFRERFQQALDGTIRFISTQGSIPVVLMRNVGSFSSPNCPITQRLFNSSLQCNSDSSKALERISYMRAVVVDLQRRYSNLLIIDPNGLLCDTNACQVTLRGIPIYLDEGHLNDVGSRILGQLYRQKFGPVFRDGS
jgi:peptidoglycan/LPS O-acetylase OafA/YrhL